MKVLDMTYQWELDTSRAILNQLEQRRDWLSSAFYYTSDWNDDKTIQKKGGPVLTFRRVENFQSMETESQWVAYYVQQKYSEEEIIERLQTEHEFSREGAIGIYGRFLQEYRTEQRNREMNVPGQGWKKGKKQIRVKNTNPGFPMTIHFTSIDHCLITVENICDFTYLNTLQVYVYALSQLAKGLPSIFQKRLEQKNKLGVSEVGEGQWEDVDNDEAILQDESGETDVLPVEEESEEEESDEEQEPGYIGTQFSEKDNHYLNRALSPKVIEEPEPEENAEEEVAEEEEEPEPEENAEEEVAEEEGEEAESVASDLSELNYHDYGEEEEEEGGGNRKQSKLEMEILALLNSSIAKPRQKSNGKLGGAPNTLSLPFTDPQYKNQNVSKYWVERMKKRDPGLFEMYAAKEKEIPNFKAYPRTCQINDQRQPILINEEEKQRIDREHPGSYTYALPYKSSENAPDMYYICPRYWCFKTGTSMTEEEVQQGKCGPPENAVPSNFSASEANKNRDTSLVHFNDKKQHRDAQGNYVQNNPGFIKHDGICMPCCFKRARPEVSCQESRQVGEYTSNDYIITDESKRLEPMKWGFLPIAIQTYFQYSPPLKEIMDGKRLKLHKPMMLRYGVEQFPNQSFLGVMADWYTAVHKLEETISVQEFREVLASAISLDQFLQYNNGTLVSVFRASPLQKQGAPFPSENPALITSTYSSIEPSGSSPEPTELPLGPNEVDYTHSKYSSSIFIQRIRPDTDAKRAIVSDAIASYENYLQFLRDAHSEIDPTYLWDAIAQPNPLLFPKGLNLVLLSLPESDMTQNVDLVCPSVAYSSQTFDVKKEAAIVLLHHGFYEPIYVLERTDKDSERTTKFFLSKNSSMLNGIVHRLMTLVRETLMTQCSPKPSVKSYTFERPMYLNQLVDTLKKLSDKYQIIGHVWNYSGKIIGIQVAPYPQTETNAKSVVVPCFPTTHTPLSSKHVANQSQRFMDDQGLWMDLPTTLSLLRKINNDSRQVATQSSPTSAMAEDIIMPIPCIPVIEVVEDDMVIGILTQTNQFLAIQPPIAYQSTAPLPPPPVQGKNPRALEKDLNTELLVLRSTNYIQADMALSTAPRPDPEREKWIRDVRLENKFYSAFRSTARLVLNLYETRGLRKQIIEKIQRYNQGRVKHRETIMEFVQVLQKLMENAVDFADFDDKVLEELYRISREREFTPCLNSENKSEPYCQYSYDPNTIISPVIEPIATEENSQSGGGGAIGNLGRLVIPKKNRVNELADNEKGYFVRLADELLRYPRIQNYLLFPTSYLTVQNTDYKITPSEVILMQSVLVPEKADDDYFKNIKVPAHMNQYAKVVPYSLTEPIQTQPYSNVIPSNHPLQINARKMTVKENKPPSSLMTEKPGMEMEPILEEPDTNESVESLESDEMEQQNRLKEYETFMQTCAQQSISVVGSVNNSTWKRMFPKNTKEIVYQAASQPQSFCCIMSLIHSYLKRPFSLHELKLQLISAYRPWIDFTQPPKGITQKKILKLLSNYNSALVKEYKYTNIVESMFMNENYIFTELDFWVLCQYMQLPVILFTSNSLKNLFPFKAGVAPVKWLLLYPHRTTEKHYFVRIPSKIESGQLAPEYHKIEPAMALDSLKDVMESPLTMAQQVDNGLHQSDSLYATNVMSLESFFVGEP